jgi:hypothetical protein
MTSTRNGECVGEDDNKSNCERNMFMESEKCGPEIAASEVRVKVGDSCESCDKTICEQITPGDRVEQHTLQPTDSSCTQPPNKRAAVSDEDSRNRKGNWITTDRPWNDVFADDNLCPYCGSGDWTRQDYSICRYGRHECTCSLCGAKWFEVVVRTPRIPPVRTNPKADGETIEFQPTRGELKTLAYHYLDRHFIEKICHAMGYSGSWEWRELEFTWRRFCMIENVLSPDKTMMEFDTYIDRRMIEVDEIDRLCDRYCGKEEGGNDEET